MKIRDHDQKCAHGHLRGHWINIRSGSAYPSNVSIPAPSNPDYEWCDGGAEINLELAASFLSNVENRREIWPEAMQAHLELALGYRVKVKG